MINTSAIGLSRSLSSDVRVHGGRLSCSRRQRRLPRTVWRVGSDGPTDAEVWVLARHCSLIIMFPKCFVLFFNIDISINHWHSIFHLKIHLVLHYSNDFAEQSIRGVKLSTWNKSFKNMRWKYSPTYVLY